MEAIKNRFRNGRVNDGQDRSHIPPISTKMIWFRIAQLGLALVYLVLVAFAAYTLNTANVSQLRSGNRFHFGKVGADAFGSFHRSLDSVSILALGRVRPKSIRDPNNASFCILRLFLDRGLFYLACSEHAMVSNCLPLGSTHVSRGLSHSHLLGINFLVRSGADDHRDMYSAVELLTNLFWLVSWAILASYASAINLPGAGRAVGGRQAPVGPAVLDPATAAVPVPMGPGAMLAQSTASEVLAAEIAIAVDAAIGAAVWFYFPSRRL